MGRISGIAAKNSSYTIDRTVVNDCIAVLKKHVNEAEDQFSDEGLADLFRSKLSK